MSVAGNNEIKKDKKLASTPNFQGVMPAFFMIDDNPTINDKDSFVNFNNPTGDNYNPTKKHKITTSRQNPTNGYDSLSVHLVFNNS
jgi:hypothetical protein